MEEEIFYVILFIAWLTLSIISLVKLISNQKYRNIDKILLFISIVIFPIIGSIVTLAVNKKLFKNE